MSIQNAAWNVPYLYSINHRMAGNQKDTLGKEVSFSDFVSEKVKDNHWLSIPQNEKKVSEVNEEELEKRRAEYLEQSEQTVGENELCAIGVDAYGISCVHEGGIIWEIPLTDRTSYEKCVGLLHQLRGRDCSIITAESFWQDFLDGKIDEKSAVWMTGQHS